MTLVCREKDVETLKKGISVTGQVEKTAHPDVFDSTPPSDLVFVTVKSYDVASAVKGIALKPDTLVVVIHNGLGSDEVAASLLGEGHVGMGVSYSGVTFLEPGKVKLARLYRNCARLRRARRGKKDGHSTGSA